MSNRREIDCVEGEVGWGERCACADDFYFALEVAH